VQAVLVVIKQVIDWPFVNVFDKKFGLVEALPTFTPFTFHWYRGEAPPFVGVAVNMIVSPGFMVEVLLEIETDGGELVFTVTTILLHTPGNGTQPPSPRTKYSVVAVGETVIDVPVPMGVPPHDVEYHFQYVALFNAPDATVKVVELPTQMLVFVAVKVGNPGAA